MTEWHAELQPLHQGLRWRIRKAERFLQVGEVLRLLHERPAFGHWYTATLTNCGLSSVYWEHPALNLNTTTDCYECVLLDAPVLSRMPADRRSFLDQCSSPDQDPVVFKSLGGDATLIAPSVQTDAAYSHLLAFLRLAPADQISRFWSKVGETTLQIAGDRPVWLSTSGLGVA